MKRTLSLILAALIPAMMFSACGDTPSNSTTSTPSQTQSDTESSSGGEAEPALVSYPLEGNPELSIAWETNTGILSYMTDWSYSDFFKWWQEDTGVKLTMTFPSDYSLLFATGEYPDMVFYQWSGYSGGPAKAIADGIIVELDEYLPENAPDYYNFISQDEALSRSLKDSNGKYYTFGYIRNDVDDVTTQGVWTRADWLEQLGLEAPQTLDEFTDMCYRMKAELGVEKLISVPSGYLLNYIGAHSIASAFGIPTTNWYQIDGKVHYGYTEEAYREILQYLHKLYADGIIDRDFQTVDTTIMFSNFLSGISGVMYGWGTRMQAMLDEMKGQEFDLAAIRNLTKNAGETPMYNGRDQKVNTYGVSVTTACKDVATACKFLNYCYTEEGNILANFGREGVSFDYVNGAPVLNQEAIAENSLGFYAMSASQGAYIRQTEIALASIYYPQIVDAYTIWNEGDTEDYRLPSGAGTRPEENDEASALGSEIGTYISECFVKFVNGDMDINTQWEEYLSTLKSMNVERYIELKQHALDDYNAR